MLDGTREALTLLLAGHEARLLEHQRLDFKEAPTDVKHCLRMLADAAVCFANADGGDIVLGVRDGAAGTDALIGVEPVLSVDLLQRGIYDRSRPQLTCIVEEISRAGKRLVVISVPRAVAPHSNSSGTATRRLGTTCLPFTPDQQREVQIARGQIDYSSQDTDASIGDLSPIEFDRMRRLLRLTEKASLADLSEERLLEALRLVGSDGRIKVAGLVLLGTEEALGRLLPAYGYSYQYRRTQGTEAEARIRGRRPMLDAVDLLMDAAVARVRVHPLNLAGGVQLRLVDYPTDALRELVVNAFIHRSYEAPGTVDIEHTDDRLEVMSPGGLVAGVTPENILSYPSTPRNRLLTEIVEMLQVAERTGQGVDRAYRAMLRNGKEPPRFDDEVVLVRAALSGGAGNDYFARFVANLPESFARDVDVLLAFSWLRAKRALTAPDLARAIQRSVSDAQRVLAELAAEHFIEPSARSARREFPIYRLRSETIASMSRALAYGHADATDRDQKVIDHVREYGFVTNRTMQRLFDTSISNARNMIAELRNRGILEKIGDARGGPGVKYGPGTKFPE